MQAELLDTEDFFAPAPTDLFSNLMAQYDARLASIHEVIAMLNDTHRGVLHYFAELDRNGVPEPTHAFKLETAKSALDAEFWDRALKMTDVLDIMPQKRRSEWHEQIRTRSTPPFEEDSVRSTILTMLGKRESFLAERIDGVFKALSPCHVTNAPQAFGKRMIINNAITNYGMACTQRAGYIDDLRQVIGRFMGREDGRAYSYEAISSAYKRPGEWLFIDGGALKLRVYKKGTAHIEVHPDMAWRLNAILATLYPGAIPESLRRKPTKPTKTKEWIEIQRPLPDAVRSALQACRQKSHEDGTYSYSVPYTSSKHVKQETEEVLVGLGGIKKDDGRFWFDYRVDPVIEEVYHSGVVPDRKTHQFYPTPESMADDLVAWADIQAGEHCCEPQAGNGDLAVRLPVERTTCVEISDLRCQVLKARGLQRVVNQDFLAYAGATSNRFDVIVMNPPFSEGRWQAHLAAAASITAPTGRVLAVLPASARHKPVLEGWHCEWSEPRTNEFAGTSVSVVLLKATRH